MKFFYLIILYFLKLASANFEMTQANLIANSQTGLTLSGDSQYGTFVKTCELDTDCSKTYQDLDTSKSVDFIPNPSYDVDSSIFDSSLEYSTAVPTNDAFFKEGRHYETKKVLYSDLPTVDMNVLRLTNPSGNSHGYATITEKQSILYGFETSFTFNIMDPYLKCDKYTCVSDIAHGFSLVIQNQNVDLDTLGLEKDSSLGYGGLNDAVAIELDFHITLDAVDPWKTHPGQPHLSVQYSNPLSADHQHSLGFCWLPFSLTKGDEHFVKIEYVRAIEEVDDLTYISFTDYNSNQFLDFSGSTDWFSEYRLGILLIYIDDTQRPVLEMPINLGSIASHDDLTTANPTGGLIDGQMAGKSYVGLSSTTSNTTDQAAAFQFLDWSFTEVDKCRVTTRECLMGRDIANTKVLHKLRLKNIGKEKLYFKFIYKNYTNADYLLDQEYWHGCIDRDGHYQEAYLDYSFFNGFLDGCEIDLHVDTTIKDVVIHDNLNETYSSLYTYFETIEETEIFNDNEQICIRKENGKIEIGFCGCNKCVEIFDSLEKYTLGKQSYCYHKYLSHSRCFCFEASKTTTTAENLSFQNHTICNECVYDSQCSWFYPAGVCSADPNNYVIGNPLTPTQLSHGFTDNILDGGLVTDGIIKGPDCDCQTGRGRYEDTSNTVESYRTFPDYQFLNIDNKDECIECLRDTSKVESDCYTLCGPGVEIDVFTFPSGWGCAQCLLSGEQFQELNSTDKAKVLDCIDTSKEQKSQIYDCLREKEDLDETVVMVGLLTHFMAECPSRSITTAGDPANGGAVCMPYYNFNYEGIEETTLKKEEAAVTKEFNEQFQCINSDCHSSTKAACGAGPCVCYDTCPTGKTYYPLIGKDWENPEDEPETAGQNKHYSKPVEVPCSGRGVCKSDGTCLCREGFLAPNCEEHCSSNDSC